MIFGICYDNDTQMYFLRKRVILSNLFSRIEVSRGYEVNVTVNMSYRQFMDLAQNEMTEENKTANAG